MGGEVLTMADVTANLQAATTASTPYALPTNLPLLSAFLSFALAQFLKIFTSWIQHHTSYLDASVANILCFRRQFVFQTVYLIFRYKEKRWDSKRLLDSGGMPSSHSATVSALAVAICLQEGAGSPAFAIAVVLACIVMYDATGVRLHAGRQAELLNQIVCELPPEHPCSNVRPLRDSLGHTPLQVVAGGTLGCIIAFLMRRSS
ncbi:putative membrane protein YuiD [Glycine soja]